MKHTAYHWILRQRELKMSHDSAFTDRVEGGLIETGNKLGQEGDLRQNTAYQMNCTEVSVGHLFDYRKQAIEYADLKF